MNSLRARLVGLLLLAVGVVWLSTAFIVWSEAHHELHELFDNLPAAVRADLEHDREDAIQEIAEHMAKPVLVAFPLLAALLLLAVTLALRPLQKLAAEVSARAPDHLTPLAVADAPREVQPLITRLNHLFADIGRAMENERRFTADASHELRTPLAAIKAQAQVALGAEATERDHALRQIVAGCNRAAHLVEQLLTLARLDAPSALSGTAALDLHAVAADTLGLSAATSVERGSPLALRETEGAPVTIRGDPVLIAVAVRNLVENALRHTPLGTRVEVAITREGNDAVLCVEDDGPGIPADERDAVLRRFGRGSEAGAEGSGLGLSIVQRIAALHGGRFTLETKVGAGGTAARLRFPCP